MNSHKLISASRRINHRKGIPPPPPLPTSTVQSQSSKIKLSAPLLLSCLLIYLIANFGIQFESSHLPSIKLFSFEDVIVFSASNAVQCKKSYPKKYFLFSYLDRDFNFLSQMWGCKNLLSRRK